MTFFCSYLCARKKKGRGGMSCRKVSTFFHPGGKKECPSPPGAEEEKEIKKRAREEGEKNFLLTFCGGKKGEGGKSLVSIKSKRAASPLAREVEAHMRFLLFERKKRRPSTRRRRGCAGRIELWRGEREGVRRADFSIG